MRPGERILTVIDKPSLALFSLKLIQLRPLSRDFIKVFQRATRAFSSPMIASVPLSQVCDLFLPPAVRLIGNHFQTQLFRPSDDDQ